MAITSQTKKTGTWQSAAASLSEINKIPGAADMIKGDPDLLKQVLDDPAGAVAFYNEHSAAIDEISKIPGVDELFKENPDLLAEVMKDPTAALETYKTGVAGASGAGPTAKVVTDGPIVTPPHQDPSTIGLQATLDSEIMDTVDTTFQESLAALSKNASQLDSLAQSYLKGEIPEDVQAQVRRLSSESGMATGLGRGQAGQALTARDLGMTSLQIQQQGVQTVQAAAGIRELMSKVADSRYQFDKSYALESQKFMEDMRRTELNAIQLEQQRQMFDAEQNLKLVGMVADMAVARAELQVKMASADIDDTNVVAAMDQVIGQLDSLIAMSST